MENIEKKMLFAQYYGQSVYMIFHPSYPYEITKIPFNDLNWDLNWVMRLRPISSITDEDAVVVAEQNKFVGQSHEASVRVGRDILHRVLETTDSQICLPYETMDYLRSKGYALPWRGYSVDDMIEKGWIKLTCPFKEGECIFFKGREGRYVIEEIREDNFDEDVTLIILDESYNRISIWLRDVIIKPLQEVNR